MDVSLNYVAVLLAAVSGIVVGSFWYGPLFGKPWVALMGFTPADMEKAKAKGMGKVMAMGLLIQLVMAYVVAHFVALLGITDMAGALQFSFWAWLGLIATGQMNNVLWEGKPFKLFAIHTGHSFVGLAAMALILTFMK